LELGYDSTEVAEVKRGHRGNHFFEPAKLAKIFSHSVSSVRPPFLCGIVPLSEASRIWFHGFKKLIISIPLR
jgi:hypothetical protein